MSAAVFRTVSFVALALVAAGLWVAVFRSTGSTVTATPAIPSFHSIFAPATATETGLPVSGVVRNGACKECTVHVGSGGLVQAEVPSGTGKRTAYALLDLGNRAASGQVLIHDVIGFGRGETPAGRVRLLQVLDSSHRVIFELVAGPDRRLYLASPAGGLRAKPLVLATGAIVPNDGVSGVAVDVVLKANGWLLVSVNGFRTAAVRSLVGARTGLPHFLAAGVIGYKAPGGGGAITATHAQVSVTTSTAPATTAAPAQPHAQQQQVPAAQPVPPPPLSSLSPPTISGRGVVGDTLTADPGTWSDGTATFTYAWERCDGSGTCTDIGGAGSKTYDLVPADRGAFVRVVVTAQAGGDDASRASTPVGPVAPAPPADLGAPTVSGDAVVGEQLTADPGSWTDPDATFTFAWQRCDPLGVCRTIDGATGARYVITTDDLGDSLQVEVTASNKGGANKADSVPTGVVVPAAPTALGAPTISGDAVVGSTLTVDPGSWSDPAATFSYVWERCDGNGDNCTQIDGANDTKYALTADDVGFHIQVTVTAANAGGTGSADSNLVGPIVPQPPTVVTAPSLSGDAVVGSTLTVDPGSWSDPAATLSYVWERCDGNGDNCTQIDGANDTKYALTADDVGFHIQVTVTAANAGGTGSADSNLVGPVVPQPPTVVTAPSLSGDAVVGSTLTVDPGSWSDPAATFSYVWERCDGNGDNCTQIDGANDTKYALTADDVGFHIQVTVTAANAGGTGSADSNLVGPIVPPPAPPTVPPPTLVTPPSVSGDPIVGSTLTADPGTWSDPAATFTYAWLRCEGDGDGDADDSCTTIESANDPTYLLTGNDLGLRIQVAVTAANAAGTATAQSTPTTPIQSACTPDNTPTSSP